MKGILSKISAEKNITLKQLSSLIGVSSELVYKINSGHRTPSKKFIKKLIACYPEINANDFI